MARTNDITYLPGLKKLMEGRKAGYVADQLGIDQSTLSCLVNLDRGASLAMALKIARYFNTTVESLCEDRQLVSAN